MREYDIRKQNRVDVLCFIVFTLIFLGLGLERMDYLVTNFPATQYLDELVSVAFLVPFFIIPGRRPKAGKLENMMVLCLLLYEATGMMGVLLYHYQPLGVSLKDAFLAIKFFLAFAGFLLFFWQMEAYEGFYRKWWAILNSVTAILLILTVLDYIFDLFYDEMRWGMPAIKLFYHHYTDLVTICAVLTAMYLRYYEKKGRATWPGLVSLFIILFSTRRAKGFLIIPMAILLILLFIHKKKADWKLKILLAVSIGVAAVTCIGQVWFYFIRMELESARSVLFVAGPWLAKLYFPFGTGWGTFGSAASASPYSPVYTLYGMDAVWGLSPSYNKYIADNYWPMVLGQCGFFGCLFLVIVLGILGYRIYQTRKISPAICASLFASFGYLLISSTSEPAFSGYVSIPHALWMGLLAAEYLHRKQQYEQEQCENE